MSSSVEKFLDWLKPQSFLTVFITSWMIINWDIVVLLIFDKETLMTIKEMIFSPQKPLIRTQVGYWIVYDIFLPFGLTAIRMKCIRNLAAKLEKISEDEKEKVIRARRSELEAKAELLDRILKIKVNINYQDLSWWQVTIEDILRQQTVKKITISENDSTYINQMIRYLPKNIQKD